MSYTGAVRARKGGRGYWAQVHTAMGMRATGGAGEGGQPQRGSDRRQVGAYPPTHHGGTYPAPIISFPRSSRCSHPLPKKGGWEVRSLEMSALDPVRSSAPLACWSALYCGKTCSPIREPNRGERKSTAITPADEDWEATPAEERTVPDADYDELQRVPHPLPKRGVGTGQVGLCWDYEPPKLSPHSTRVSPTCDPRHSHPLPFCDTHR